MDRSCGLLQSEVNMSGQLTRALAERASALEFEELPPEVLKVARQALLDWFGVTLGGSHEAGPEILLRSAGAAADDGATVVGHELRVPTLVAALVNGTASHVLDFDDVNALFLGHASVAVVGAALALGEQLDASGSELLVAFVAGYETACRVAVAIGPQPYIRGWHYTGTAGTFGAAAACARLLALDGSRTAIAFGIAASEAAGLKCNIGTMTKSLHAGRACENGLLAALLAADGFTASPDAIEAEQGFAALAGGECDVEAALADPPSGWYLLDNLFKYHASCYWTHSTIEGVLGLRAEHDLTADEVESVELHVSDLELGTCVIPSPAIGLEVKFSIAHLAAMALLGRDLSVIADDDASDPEVIEVRDRVRLARDGVARQPTRVTVRRRNGSELEAAVDVNKATRDLEAQGARLERKFLAFAEPVLGAETAASLAARIGELGSEVTVRDLMALTRAGVRA
jgi:2-methylcitrate dehydratase PrpD